MRLFGRDIDRTSGELEAVLTQLQLGEIPTRGLFERVVLCCLFCLSRRSYLWRSSASSGAIVWSYSCGSCLVYERREVFVHERSRVLRCHLGRLSLFFFSWCVFLFDGTMLSTLAIVVAMTWRLRRCRRNCGPRGSIASTIVGALCCECCWLGGEWGVCSSGPHRAEVSRFVSWPRRS